MRLDGKVALVTGAGRGIGLNIAQVLSSSGAKVVLADITDELGMAAAEDIKKAGGEAIYCHIDVTREEEWKQIIKMTVESFGGLDIIVNNAGGAPVGNIEDVTTADWHQVMALNVDGVFFGVREGIIAMKPGGIAGKGGSIINISSICGLIGLPGASAYCTAKGAVRLLSKAAGVECGRLQYGIRVNSVHPGFIKNERAMQGFQDMAAAGLFPSAADAEAAQVAMHPIGRMGSTEDVAQAVLYLASDSSSFVTGTEFVVDGGFTAQ